MRQFTTAAATFESACRLDMLPAGHPASRLHGHSYVARVAIDGAGGVRADAPERLRQRLVSVCGALDHRLLNDLIDTPTDENVARWIRTRIGDAAGPVTVGVQSTGTSGVDLDPGGRAHVWRRYRFEAAHQLPNVPAGHQCGRMHGHGFEVILHACVDLGDAPMGPDFAVLDACWAPLAATLDGACLNDVDGLGNPTSEILARWIWRRVRDRLESLSWVSVYETATAGCHYDGRQFRIWKERGFESAVPHPPGHADGAPRGLYGHSYLARLHLTAPLDDLLGWTVDYGDVKRLFEPTWRRLDHHRLDSIDDLDEAGTAGIARWIAARLADDMPELDRVDLYETPGCGVILQWGPEPPALPAQMR